MCGIVGYVGEKAGISIALDTLKRLEYRGYDSCGVAFFQEGRIKIIKRKGRIDGLAESVLKVNPISRLVLGHTRWATHGEPTEQNAHPFISPSGDFAIVHNGIIENYIELRQELISNGYCLLSQTDSEVIAFLLDLYRSDTVLATIKKVMARLKGTYALGIATTRDNDAIYAVKKDNPLIIGKMQNSYLFCSDMPTVSAISGQIYPLQNGEIARLTAKDARLYQQNGRRKKITYIHSEKEQLKNDSCEDYMKREMEQISTAMADSLCGYAFPDIEAGKVQKIVLTACGTSFHATQIAARILQRFAKHLHVSAILASELADYAPSLDHNSLLVAVSQSGETLDTLTAINYAKQFGAKILAVANVQNSTMTSICDYLLYIRAGREIAVASTKAYNATLMTLFAFVLDFAYRLNALDETQYYKLFQELNELPLLAMKITAQRDEIATFCQENEFKRNVFYLGRGLDYYTAKEGSLKLKEVSYICAEAYPSGELKHGALALVEKGVLVVSIITDGRLLEKGANALAEVKARGATTVTVTPFDTPILKDKSDYTIKIPCCDALLSPVLAVIPCQWLAYYAAKKSGRDVDKPRNLAKSVTVN